MLDVSSPQNHVLGFQSRNEAGYHVRDVLQRAMFYFDEHPELDKFITKKIKEKATKNIKIDLVSENEIEIVAKRIKKEIDKHS